MRQKIRHKIKRLCKLSFKLCLYKTQFGCHETKMTCQEAQLSKLGLEAAKKCNSALPPWFDEKLFTRLCGHNTAGSLRLNLYVESNVYTKVCLISKTTHENIGFEKLQQIINLVPWECFFSQDFSILYGSIQKLILDEHLQEEIS